MTVSEYATEDLLLSTFWFLLLELVDSLGYMMRSENHLELISVDDVGFFIGVYICIPPIG
jgi:hypothetical protein